MIDYDKLKSFFDKHKKQSETIINTKKINKSTDLTKTSSTYRSTIQNMGTGYDIISFLRLRGKWLMENGFYPGDVCEINAENGILTIRVIEEDKTIRQREQQLKDWKLQR